MVLYSEMTPQSLVPGKGECLPASGSVWIMGPGEVPAPFHQYAFCLSPEAVEVVCSVITRATVYSCITNPPSHFPSQFVECLKLNKKPFHLMGTSMGGNVAGVYAAYYPSDICSLTLVCPAGELQLECPPERMEHGRVCISEGPSGSICCDWLLESSFDASFRDRQRFCEK